MPTSFSDSLSVRKLLIIMMMRPLLLASLLSATLIIPAPGEDLPGAMTMHRLQAGEPDGSGWMLAESTEGGFSVRLPLKFNDFTMAESDPKSPAMRLYIVGTKSEEGIKFMATRVVYRKGAESAKDFFSRAERGADLKPERITPQKVGERRAVDMVLKRTSDIAYQRTVLLEEDLLVMVVESPRRHNATAHHLATQFFDSLVVSVK